MGNVEGQKKKRDKWLYERIGVEGVSGYWGVKDLKSKHSLQRWAAKRIPDAIP